MTEQDTPYSQEYIRKALSEGRSIVPSITPGPVYIAGPMTGLPNYNYPAFQAMADKLRKADICVISPHELFSGDTGLPWHVYMQAGLTALLKCKAVVLLKGWDKSRGAKLEREVAVACGMLVLEEA